MKIWFSLLLLYSFFFHIRDDVKNKYTTHNFNNISVGNQNNTEDTVCNEFLIERFYNEIMKVPSYEYFEKNFEITGTQFISYFSHKTDTCFTFAVASDTLTFFAKQFLSRMVITSNNFILDSQIYIHMSKRLFYEKVGLKIFNTSSLTISNIEGHINFTFIFERDKLVKIIYELTYFG